MGPIEFHDRVQGGYAVLFAHPSAYSATAETEILDLARHAGAFVSLGCTIVGLSQSDPMTEQTWLDELTERTGLPIPFPVLSDEDGRIGEALGLTQETTALNQPVGKVFVIGPDLLIRAIFECTHPVPCSASDLLRVLRLLKAAAV